MMHSLYAKDGSHFLYHIQYKDLMTLRPSFVKNYYTQYIQQKGLMSIFYKNYPVPHNEHILNAHRP